MAPRDETLPHLRSLIANAQAKRERAEAERDEASARRDKAEAERADAEATAARYSAKEQMLEDWLADELGSSPDSGDVAPEREDQVERPDPGATPSPASETGPSTPQTMTDTISALLAGADRPLGPKEIADMLGHEDSESVRGILAYMRQKGVAVARGRGNWVLIGGKADASTQAAQLDPRWPGDSRDPDGQESSVNGHRPPLEVNF